MAQVVGARYSMGKEPGDVATIVKLLRVAMLLPVILAALDGLDAPALRRKGRHAEAPGQPQIQARRGGTG